MIATPERPWSPSVPAALTTQGLCRRRTKDRETEKADNAKGPGQTKSTLLTETPSSGSPTPAPPTSPPDDNEFPMKLEPTLVTALANGGPLTAFLGKLSNHLSSDVDKKMPHQTSTHLSSRTNSFTSALTHVLPPTEKPPSSPQFPRTEPALPPPHLSVDGHGSPPLSVSSHSHPPGVRRDQSPSHLSPVSSRGAFSYGPLENSATNIPSHTSSPKMSPRKPQTFSWPPFRPNLDEGSTDFDPPFRAGPDFCEPPPPPPFRPTSGPATVRTFTAPAPGRPAAISNSNSNSIPPRYSPCVPPSTPGGPSSPTMQPFFPSSISPQPPLNPPQGTALDGNYPPRQPRADAAMQAMASVSLGQGVVTRSQPQYHHQREYLIFVATECLCGSWLRSRGANGPIQKGTITRRTRLLMVVGGEFPWLQAPNVRHHPLAQNPLHHSRFR